MTPAEKKHLEIIKQYPLYEETAHWTPVLCENTMEASADRFRWAANRGLKRGDQNSRNDFLIPVSGFWLFKDPKVAAEFKLLWG